MKTIKIKNINTDETIEMKPYLIGDIPPSFDKNKDIHFNRGGITYIEKKTDFGITYDRRSITRTRRYNK